MDRLVLRHHPQHLLPLSRVIQVAQAQEHGGHLFELAVGEVG
jgi:hypothetical protein